MKKLQNYHLPKVNHQLQPEIISLNIPNQLEAQDYLFEISRIDDHQHDNVITNLLRQPSKKLQSTASMALPKRKKKSPGRRHTPVEIKAFREDVSSQNVNGQQINITNYLIIGDRKHLRRSSGQLLAKIERSSIHQQINRKAKHLFRLRNRHKMSVLEDYKSDQFQQSFYCKKIGPVFEQM